MAVLSQSPEIVQQLLLFETNLDGIRRFIEHMPSRSRNKAKLLVEHIFDREARRLKTELKRTLNTLLEESAKSLGYSDISRRDSIFELASLTARAAGVICDAPVLNFLKPIVGIAVIICDTAKHSSVVTKSIVDHAASLDHSAANNGEALMALKSSVSRISMRCHEFISSRRSALEDIQLYLAALQNPRRLLALFTSANTLSTHAEVRSHGHQLKTLVRLNGNVKAMLTIMQADLASMAVIAMPQTEGEKTPESTYHSFRSIFADCTALNPFFFRS
ncbi:hypothetical protein B0H14DRAFT_2734101 [Mycena olivaceomarginata]|nr:hypothetical protein B0H14DRAFT_2734101 [Mycena olivaceomarginata]